VDDSVINQGETEAFEARFLLHERRRRIPQVRVYAVMAIAFVLVYGLVNPLFFSRSDAIAFNLMMIPTVVVLGGYCAATFWPRYADHTMVDFACLLAFGLLVVGDNVLIKRDLWQIDPALHASVAINMLIVIAFAALALAGQMRLFLVWLGCHALAFTLALLSTEPDAVPLLYAFLSYATGAMAMVFLNWALGRSHREAFGLGEALDTERARIEELLYNVLPPVAAQRLKAGQVVADAYSDASVVFIDVVGFSTLARRVSPGHLIDMLNAFFSLADRCTELAGIEKVKTIGDAYLAISGGNVAAANSAEAAVRFGEAVLDGLSDIHAATGIAMQVRIGIHSGPVVGGVIGATRMAYDYWGETMNIASRIEGAAEPGGIAVSEATYMRLQATHAFAEPQLIPLKGVGEMPVYRLIRNKATPEAVPSVQLLAKAG